MQRRNKTEAGLGNTRPVSHPTQRLPTTADRSAPGDRGVSCPSPNSPEGDPKHATGTRKVYRPASDVTPTGATIPAPGLASTGADSEEPPAVSQRAPKVAAPSSRPRHRTSRPALRVDDVGAAAVEIAAKVKRSSKPRLIGRASISDAPLNPQEAFILSMIDGKLTMEALADVSGFRLEDVFQVVERLVRLNLVAC